MTDLQFVREKSYFMTLDQLIKKGKLQIDIEERFSGIWASWFVKKEIKVKEQLFSTPINC